MTLLSAIAGSLRSGMGSVTITGRSITDTTISPTNASVSLIFNSDGSYSSTTVGDGETSYGDWITPTAFASGYQIMATETSGTLSSGTTATWVSPTQTWTVDRSSLGFKTCTIRIDIRPTGGSIVATANFTLRAEKSL